MVNAVRCMLIMAVFVTLFANGFGLQAQGPPEFPPGVAAALDVALAAEVQGKGLPGAVLLIDTPSAHFVGASGYADLEAQTLLQPDAAFQIGSITKIFTSVLVLQLVEEGVLALDDLLSVWLPDFAATVPNGDQITLRHLLQHTSGLPDIQNNVELLAQYIADPYQPLVVQDIINHTLTHYGTDFAPGEEWRYNGGTTYLMLGLVIEAVTDEPYAEVLRNRILTPVGMTHTYVADLEPAAADLVHGYAWRDNEWIDVTAWNRVWAGAAGGLVSTPSDLALFIRALFKGDLFIEADTLDEMLDTTASGDAKYGLGIRHMTAPDDPDLGWGHGGSTLGYQAMLIYLPATDMVFVAMTNNGERIPALDIMLRPALAYWGVSP